MRECPCWNAANDIELNSMDPIMDHFGQILNPLCK